MAKAAKGSLEPGADVPEAGQGGANLDDLPPYRHPREGQPPQSRAELLPGGNVPGDQAFEQWWDELSPAEHEMLWGNGRTDEARDIRDIVLGSNQTHEWLKRSQLDKLKKLGFSMREIRAFTTPTKDAHGPKPRTPGTTWRHNPEGGGRGSGVGSGAMRKSLDRIIKDARSQSDLLRRYGYWANSWLYNGIDDLPESMRDEGGG